MFDSRWIFRSCWARRVFRHGSVTKGARRRREMGEERIYVPVSRLYSLNASAGAPGVRIPPESNSLPHNGSVPTGFCHTRTLLSVLCRRLRPTTRVDRGSVVADVMRTMHRRATSEQATMTTTPSMRTRTLHHRCGDTRCYVTELDTGFFSRDRSDVSPMLGSRRRL